MKALVPRGHDPEGDGVSTWRAKDLCRIVADRFGVSYAENGMLRLLHDLGLSWQKARPIHSEADRQAQARFQKFRALIAAIAREHPEAERFEVPRRGTGRPDLPRRPTLVPEGHAPARGARPAPPGGLPVRRRLPGERCRRRPGPAQGERRRHAGELDELSQAVSPGAHAVVLMDRAGWHIAKGLAIPANLTPLFLPPYSLELNAIERVWLYLRERSLSHRL